MSRQKIVGNLIMVVSAAITSIGFAGFLLGSVLPIGIVFPAFLLMCGGFLGLGFGVMVKK